MKNLASFLAAVSFLTFLPARWPGGFSPQALSVSRAWFPLVGLLLGLLLLGVERGAREIFPVYLTAALLTVLLIALTRGLHLDGFMDVCDGLFGGYTPERRREIMRDSHVGAFAVAGAAGILLLKYAALLSLLSLNAPGKEIVLLLFPTLSRWTMTLLLASFPYARSQGLGSPFHQSRSRIATAVAAIIATAAALILGGYGGLILLTGISALAWLMGKAMSRMLDGLTGDCYGAANETAEVAILIAAVAMLPYGLLGAAHQIWR